ncbi:PKD domain-containing protein [Muriicola sp. Z0-33]|uniref:PKD domain-containing protein n=1 Tax=Muriicola sp. Z0-33 TaxID=2816957 RepID=UPI002238C2D0|nr:PKD domain-containing protein [Muriicola sp. Z0-33]MCW5516484.1 PKD domain-containing protein [Muriicola sp. Z0-33]
MQNQSRYPGTRAFLEKERHLFFGRDRDKKKLGNLIALEELVVLFGKAGYGKSSLLNAGVIPYLRHLKHHLPVKIHLTPAEVKSKESKAKPLEIIIDQLGLQIEIINKELEEKNRESCFLATKLDVQKHLPEDLTAILWYKIKYIQLTKEINEATTLIFDQFEALFRFYDDANAEEFARSMAALLHTDPPDEILELISENLNSFSDEELELLYEPLNLKLVFSVASDHLSLLNKLKQWLPEIFKYTYELKALNRAQAQEALEGPAQKEEKFESPKYTYSDEVIDKIFDYLINVKNKEGIELENQDIETFQLQLIGQYAEEKIKAQRNRSELKAKIKGWFKKSKATPKANKYELSLKDLGKPSDILKKFYKKVIFGLPPFNRYPAQKLVERGLIIGGNRVPMSDSRIERDYKVSGETLEKLENKHLLRSEFKIKDGRGTKSYEISHYNLVKPIEEAVRRRKIRRLWYLIFLLLAFIAGLGYVAFGPDKEKEISNGLIINAIGVATAWPPEGPAEHKVRFTFTNMDSLNEVKVVRHSWDFGDELSVADTVNYGPKNSELIYTYQKPGNYTARLTVICTDSLDHPTRIEEVEIIVTEQDTINDKISVKINADPAAGKVGEPVKFNAIPSSDTLSIKSYLWEFMDGPSSTDPTPTHTFSAKGTYNVRLKVTDHLNKIYRDSLIIQIGSVFRDSANKVPVARIRASPWAAKPGQPIFFDGRESSDDNEIIKYLWEFDDEATSNKDSLTHTFNAEGDYIVRLTVSDDFGHSDPATKEIKILNKIPPPPNAGISVSDTVGIMPFEVTFNVDSLNHEGSRYAWKFPDGRITNEKNPTHIFALAGSYNVELTVEDDFGHIAIDSIRIRVANPIPVIETEMVPIALAEADRTNGVAPLRVTFNGKNDNENGSGSTYEWEFKDGSPVSTTQNPVHEFTSSGEYDVLLTVRNNNLTHTDTVRITVIEPPEINRNPIAKAEASPPSGEVPLTVSFKGSNENENSINSSYQWHFNDNEATSDLPSPEHTFNEPGTYDVELTVTENDISDKKSIQILVEPLKPRNEWEKWFNRFDSIKNSRPPSSRGRLDTPFYRDSVHLVALVFEDSDSNEFKGDALLFLLAHKKVYKFRNGNIPHTFGELLENVPFPLESLSRLGRQESRKDKVASNLRGGQYINPKGELRRYKEKNAYLKLFNLIIDDKKIRLSKIIYTVLPDNFLDPVAQGEIKAIMNSQSQ